MDRSKILTFFNMKLDTFIIAVTIMTVILIITLFFLLLDYLKIRKRYMEFMTGESGKNLEYTIYKRFREIDVLKEGQKDNDNQIEIIYDMVRRSYNKIGIYHYNAFSPSRSFNGGSISFALALLNSSHNGFVLNVIHNRAGCHVYLKEIQNGSCKMTLAEEEMKAVEMAIEYKKEDIMNIGHDEADSVEETQMNMKNADADNRVEDDRIDEKRLEENTKENNTIEENTVEGNAVEENTVEDNTVE